MCEMVMLGEDIPKQLKSNGLKCYPGMEESDDEDLDAMSESYDMQMGTTTEILCEKCSFLIFLARFTDSATFTHQIWNSVTEHVPTLLRGWKKWIWTEKNLPQLNISSGIKIQEIYRWRNNPKCSSAKILGKKSPEPKKDILYCPNSWKSLRFCFATPSWNMQDSTAMYAAPLANFTTKFNIYSSLNQIFVERSHKIDSHMFPSIFQAQIGVPVRKYRIFMCMLPKEERSYPLQVVVLATTKVQEFIGLICHKYASEHPDHPLK